MDLTWYIIALLSICAACMCGIDRARNRLVRGLLICVAAACIVVVYGALAAARF
jgi:hypothetical protein